MEDQNWNSFNNGPPPPMTGKSVMATLRNIRGWYGDVPPPLEVSTQLDISKEEADSLWQDFLDKEDGKKVEKPVEVPPPRQKRKYVRKPKPEPVAVEAPKKKGHAHDLPLEAIKTIAGLTSLVIAVRMVGYLVEYFSLWETNELLAWATGVSLALILFVSLQVAVMSLRGKQPIMLATSVLLFLVLAFIDISGTSTIIAHKKQAVVAVARTESEEILKARAQEPQLKASIEKNSAQVETLSLERRTLLADQAALDRTDEKYDLKYAQARNRLSANKASLDAVQKKVDDDGKKLEKIQALPGFYSKTVANAEDGNASFLDWCVAFGLGLVGPWALSVTLFLRGKNEEDHRDTTKELPRA